MKVSGFDWKNQKVLVTGASGFQGSWLCKTLLELGATVYGTTRNQIHPLSAYNILDLDQHIIKIEADISDRQQVYDTLNSVNPDIIFHLAAKALVPVSLRDPRRTFEVNIAGTINLIEASRKLKVCQRLLIASTDHVFGKIKPEELPENGFNEKSRVSYGGPYDTSKAAMELVVRSYHYTYWDELPAIGITRCANVFGYGDTNQRRVIPLFVTSTLNRESIPLKYRYNGRQFLHVGDAIAGYIRVVSELKEGDCFKKASQERPEDRSPFTPTYHFAIENYEKYENPEDGPNYNSCYIRMKALAYLIARIFDSQVDDSKSIDFVLNENRVQALNCSETKKTLGWKPHKTLEEALRELGEWYQQQNNLDRLKQLINQDIDRLIKNLVDP